MPFVVLCHVGTVVGLCGRKEVMSLIIKIYNAHKQNVLQIKLVLQIKYPIERKVDN